VSYFGSALRLDEPEKRRSRALVLKKHDAQLENALVDGRAVTISQ
jgi:hypothetical protein